MKEVDKFDPLFFGISPREAEMMDPQQRLFLQTVWKAIEDSGHKASDLAGTRTGVFVGAATNDYADLLGQHQVGLDGYTASGNSHSVLANRVSFLLDLRGPSAPIDTACSSSLIALHRALESIHTGSCDMAIVGGVQVMLTPAAYISFGKAGMLSNDGKCKTFDQHADGYVRGEGVGAIFIKPLAMAEADKNPIYAVIRATAENHGGRATVLTAPNPNAQAELMIEAYEKAGIDPGTIGYIECHGTGTSLGDPIEVQALIKTFAELYKRHGKAPATTPHCGLSSVKTNIGHLETAAGIAAILKVLLAIRHKKIPASLHLKKLNPYINLKGAPIYIVEKTMAWEAVKDENGSLAPRRAGISSFGFGGANAHVVVEEYIKTQRADLVREEARTPQLILLSAKTKDRLEAYAGAMLTYLQTHGTDLTEFAHTLQVGREPMAERLGFSAKTTDEVMDKLGAFLRGDESIPDFFRGRAPVRGRKNKPAGNESNGGGHSKAVIDQWLHENAFTNLLRAWTAGADVNWSKRYGSMRPRRLALPTYPFAKERYWIDTASGGWRARAPQNTSVLHPVLHANTSDLGRQCYRSYFNGKEYFLSDCKIKGRTLLPEAVCLEMAREAFFQACPDCQKASGVVIRNVVWAQPVAVAKNTPVTIALFADEQNSVDYEIYGGEGDREILHAQGAVSFYNASAPARLDIAQIKAQLDQEVEDAAAFYRDLEDNGYAYGPSQRTITRVRKGEGQILTRLRLADAWADDMDVFSLHPSLMNGALQAAMGLIMALNGRASELSSPVFLKELRIESAACAQEMYAWARWARGCGPMDDSLKLDVDLIGADGTLCVAFKSLSFNNQLFHSAGTSRGALFELLYDMIHPSEAAILKAHPEKIALNDGFEELLESILHTKPI